MGRKRTKMGMSEEFIPRNKDIAERYTEFEESLQRIGDRYSISRERVRQILARMGIGRRSPGQPSESNLLIGEPCSVCKEKMVQGKIVLGICQKCYSYKNLLKKMGPEYKGKSRRHEMLDNCIDCGKDITQDRIRAFNRCNACRTKNFYHSTSRKYSRYYIPQALYPKNCLNCKVSIEGKKKSRGFCYKCYSKKKHNKELDPNFGKELITQPLEASS